MIGGFEQPPHQSIALACGAAVEVALRHALERNEFTLHYQPLVLIATGEAIGMEALIRWRNPLLGSMSPADFIPLAEELGLITSIGEWVLRTACAQNRVWQNDGLPAMTMAVNVCALQLREARFADLVVRVLEETGLDPHCLGLEITESMLTGKTDDVIRCLHRLRGLGITISMDDFGTGYSNLGYLAHFPLDTLKIDRSFVRDLPESQVARSIAQAIVSMGRSLDMRVVAEGVETIQQAQFLESIWCQHAQGYLYCKPLPADEFVSWVGSRGAPPGDAASAVAAVTERTT